MYTPTSDAHLAYLAEAAGYGDAFYELFLDDELMAMTAEYHNKIVAYIKANYVNVSGIE